MVSLKQMLLKEQCLLFRGVAQPGSVLAWGASGRRFKSGRPELNQKTLDGLKARP